jgi:hypothetical protein
MDDLATTGVKFCNDLQEKYRPDKRVGHIMYEAGVVEAMVQLEAQLLALQKVPFEKLTPAAVLTNGFYQIKNLPTGDITSTPLSYGKGKIQGVDQIRIDQVQNGKSVKVGMAPVHDIYTKQ